MFDQVIKYQRHRFSFMINELKSQLSLDYNASVLAFANCLINSYEDINERAEIRNEFIGLFFDLQIILMFFTQKFSNFRNYVISLFLVHLKLLED